MFLQNQDFFQICPSSLDPDSYTIGQVRLYEIDTCLIKCYKEQSVCLSFARIPSDLRILVEIYVIQYMVTFKIGLNQ